MKDELLLKKPKLACAEKVIRDWPPKDGRDWECQCARCGSSCVFLDCDNCEDGWIEDDDWQADEGDGYTCDWCQGHGGHWQCCSSEGWCRDHPGFEREAIERGQLEWFTFDEKTKSGRAPARTEDPGE